MREHIIAFGIAFFLLAGGVLLFSKDGSSLLADITSFSWQSEGVVSDLPMVYQIVDWTLQIKTTKQFSDIKSVQFYVIYDTENTILQVENATSPYEYTYAASSENMIFVSLFPKKEISTDTVLYTLPLSGTIDGITISDMSISWENGWVEKVAIQKK